MTQAPQGRAAARAATRTAPRMAPRMASHGVEAAMRRALELAAQGPAYGPNPRVGCVLLDPGGRTVAEWVIRRRRVRRTA